jgi:uracil-DNA glycosylase
MCSSRATGSWSCARHEAFDLPITRLAAARQPRLPRLRWGRSPDRVAARRGGACGTERRPWRGRAGQALRRWLELDEERFYETFYLAAVTRCYPGKPLSGRGDRTTTPEERRLCAFWQEWELRLLRPRLLVPVGGVAIKRLLGLGSLACVGERIELNGAVAIPLPHPSGASGWLNDPRNRERLERALGLLRAELSQRL